MSESGRGHLINLFCGTSFQLPQDLFVQLCGVQITKQLAGAALKERGHSDGQTDEIVERKEWVIVSVEREGRELLWYGRDV